MCPRHTVISTSTAQFIHNSFTGKCLSVADAGQPVVLSLSYLRYAVGATAPPTGASTATPTAHKFKKTSTHGYLQGRSTKTHMHLLTLKLGL